MNNKITKNQALLTAVGFMIGSGIFFKADDIVASVNGNIVISLLSWVFASTTLIFAGVSVAIIASQKSIEGGFVGYIEYYFSQMFSPKVGKTLGFIVGWYQIVIYIPILVTVVSRTFIDYFFQLLGLDVSNRQLLIGAIIMFLLMFMWNGLSTKIGALISSTATVVKVIPLIVIALIGVIFGDWSNITHTTNPGLSTTPIGNFSLFLAPLMALSFAFDGWVSVGSLSKDMKDPQKDLPFVFVVSIIITSILYIMYYLGINLLMPGADIVSLGNGHVAKIASETISPLFSKFIIFAVMISVLGTANGIFMAGSRYVHKLASSDLLFGSNFFKQETKYGTVFNASTFILVGCIICNILYTIQGSLELNSFNIDDIPMAFNALFYIFLFIITIYLFKSNKANLFNGLIAPIVAIGGQLIVIFAFMATVDGAFIFALISLIVIGLGFINSFSANFKLD